MNSPIVFFKRFQKELDETDEYTDRQKSKMIKEVARFCRERGYYVDTAKDQHVYINPNLLVDKRQIWSSKADELIDHLLNENAITKYTLLGKDRLYILWQAIQNTHHLNLPSVEVGVYKGGTSLFIAKAFEALSGKFCGHYAIDTFAGHMAKDITSHDSHHKEGFFSDVDAQSTISMLKKAVPEMHILQGTFSEQKKHLKNQSFSFAHIDTDLYQPTMDCLDFFSRSLAVGGVLIVDDYLAPKCQGVTDAVQEYMSQPNKFQLWSMATQQAIFIKVKA